MWNSYTKFILHFLQTLSKTTEMFRKLRVMASALKRFLMVLNLFLYKGEKSSSKSSLSGHSRKTNSSTYGHLHKTLFFSTPNDTSSVFLHSHKQLAPVTDTFFTSQGCLLTRVCMCFLSLGQQFYNKMEKMVLKSYPFACLNTLFIKS